MASQDNSSDQRALDGTTTTTSPVTAVAAAVLMEEGHLPVVDSSAATTVPTAALDDSSPPSSVPAVAATTATTTTTPTAVPEGGGENVVAVTADVVVVEEGGAAGGHPGLGSTATAMNPLPGGASATRAEFISATVIKQRADQMLGLSMTEDPSGNIRISSLSDGNGVLHNSPLRVGDKLLSIEGKSCFEMDKETASALLRQATGIVTIVAHNQGGNPQYVETMVEKPSRSAPVGIGMLLNQRGSLEVSKVTASGLFAHSLLNVGDRVISINNVGCQHLEARAAVDMIRDAPKYVTILTQTSAGVVVASATNGNGEGGLAATVEIAPEFDYNQEARRFQHHFCMCTWMLIISLAIVSVVVFRPF